MNPGLFSSARNRYLPVVVLALAVCTVAAFSSLPVQSPGASGRKISQPWPYPENAHLWAALDQMIERIPLDGKGRLKLNGRTAAALQRGAVAVTHPLRRAERRRIRFLLQRALPTAAEEVSGLFFSFLAYTEALSRLPDPHDPAARRRLQQNHFGGDAEALFYEENALIQAMRGGAS